MIYRTLGRTGIKVSQLGFGAMRLPVIDGDPGRIDEPEATRMIRAAIDGGVSYVDTAYPYHKGRSEPFLAHALAGGYREKVVIATKMPTWEVSSRDDMDRLLGEQMERLDVEDVDLYLLHALNGKEWDRLLPLGVLDFLDQCLDDGLVGNVGFSFHDNLESFKRIVDGYDWSFCQIQYNFMDENNQAGTAGLEYAARKGLGIVVMEPIRGGRLSMSIPPEIRSIWDTAPVKRTPAEWALRWVWDHPEVSVVLSGMSTMDQVTENLATASNASPLSLTDEEKAIISRVRDIYQEKVAVPCTGCNYCMPCPEGVDIPRNFSLLNDARMFGVEMSKNVYRNMMKPGERADHCIDCGRCEELCPQGIAVREALRSVHQELSR